MFFLSQIWRSIWRNKIRSLLTIGITMLLLSFVGIYLGNVEKNQLALNKLASIIPVKAQVTNMNGARSVGLEINPDQADALLDSEIKDPVYTAQAGGNLNPADRAESVKFCDTSIEGANSFTAFNSFSPESVKMAAGKNESFLAGKEPVCLVSDSYAARYHLALGKALNFPVYTYRYNRDGTSFNIKKVGEAALTVIGIFPERSASDDEGIKNMIVPVNWLRSFAEKNKASFYYDSFRFAVKNPLELNAFKIKLAKLNFFEVQADAADQRTGSAVMIQDQVFIESATKLRQNLETLERFQLPVFLLVVLLVVLVMFLLLRSRRREIAIASSLGRRKILSALGLFVENFILVLIGCILTVPISSAAIGNGMWEVVVLCLPFLGCACIGIGIALPLLLRFDTMSLLTKID